MCDTLDSSCTFHLALLWFINGWVVKATSGIFVQALDHTHRAKLSLSNVIVVARLRSADEILARRIVLIEESQSWARFPGWAPECSKMTV